MTDQKLTLVSAHTRKTIALENKMSQMVNCCGFNNMSPEQLELHNALAEFNAKKRSKQCTYVLFQKFPADKETKMYKVYTSCEVTEVETLEDAKEIVASEWIQDAKPDSKGFVNPWIDDEEGNQVEYTPSQEEIDTWH